MLLRSHLVLALYTSVVLFTAMLAMYASSFTITTFNNSTILFDNISIVNWGTIGIPIYNYPNIGVKAFVTGVSIYAIDSIYGYAVAHIGIPSLLSKTSVNVYAEGFVSSDFVVYFSYFDTETGIPVCFALRNCTLVFMAVNSTYVNVTIAGWAFTFTGNGVVYGRIFLVPGWSNVTVTFVNNYGNSTVRVVRVYTMTAAVDLSAEQSSILSEAIVSGKTVFYGYNVPAVGETIYVENVNTSTSVTVVSGDGGVFSTRIPLTLGVNRIMVRLAHGGTYYLTVNVLAMIPSNPEATPPPVPNLTPVFPAPGTPGGMIVLSTMIALWIMMAKMVGWDYATFIVGAMITAYGVASGSSVVYDGGMLMMAGGLVLLLWKRSR